MSHLVRRLVVLVLVGLGASEAGEFPKPFVSPCVEREQVFEFTEKPAVKGVGEDKYEITFAVKGACDATVAVVDEQGRVVRHLASGVLGANAPAPFLKNALRQVLYWNGKDDLDSYVRESTKLRVRVQLGLKPEFDKRLGGVSPKNIAGQVIGIGIGEDGAYLFTKGGGSLGHAHLRRFDHDGKYLATLVPPPAHLPPEKLAGLGYIEHEQGQRALHSAIISDTVTGNGFFLPGVNGEELVDLRPAIAGGRIYYLNGGSSFFGGRIPSLLRYLGTDGSTDPQGLAGLRYSPWPTDSHLSARLAVSPDGKRLYMVGLAGEGGSAPVVLRRSVEGEQPAELFAGKTRKDRFRFEVGSNNETFNNPLDVACDAQERVYVADCYNNRVQILSPEGKWLKTIPADRPRGLAVHQKSGAIYLLHFGQVKGRSVPRLTKFTSFEQPEEEFHLDGVPLALMALDSWTAKPRLWMGGSSEEQTGSLYESIYNRSGSGVVIWEEDGKSLRKIADFDQEAKAEAGENYLGRWSACIFDHVNADPLREQLYFMGFRGNPWVFDLPTGKRLKRIHMPGSMNDFSFDKRGYLHCHMDPGFFAPGVARLDPANASVFVDHFGAKHPGTDRYAEVPYDYGIPYEYKGSEVLRGILPVKDQPGAKFFQDGLGVNMMGEVAVQSNIYYIPRMEEDSFRAAYGGELEKAKAKGQGSEHLNNNVSAQYQREIQERLRRGEELYSLPRYPGQALSGATIWTFDRSGEVRKENALVAGQTMAGVQVDEAGYLYFVNCRVRQLGKKVFLAEQGGNLGGVKELVPQNRNPITGTFLKTKGSGAKFILSDAAVPPDPLPARTPDLSAYHSNIWVEGAEWIYAGASPIIASGCTCASQRFHLDWFQRSYLPEAYRHSIGVLDSNGNLILHIGRYGNFDSGEGAKSRVPVGGDGIGLTLPRFVSGTDNYLAFDDWGERLTVLKLKYHAEETAPFRDP